MASRRWNNGVDMDAPNGLSERLVDKELSDNGRNNVRAGSGLLVVSRAEERCSEMAFLTQVLTESVGNG
jgi:hypothetical protein